MRAERDQLPAELEWVRELLKEIGLSGVEFDDERLRYVTVQVPRDLWDAAREGEG